MRLPPMMIGGIAFPVGFFLLGWAGTVGQLIGLVAIGMAFLLIFQAGINYLSTCPPSPPIFLTHSLAWCSRRIYDLRRISRSSQYVPTFNSSCHPTHGHSIPLRTPRRTVHLFPPRFHRRSTRMCTFCVLRSVLGTSFFESEEEY